MSESSRINLRHEEKRGIRAIEGNVSAASQHAREFRRRRGREAAEEASGQA
jgi:hypothetical protein